MFASTPKTTEFFRLITKKVNPKEMVLKTNRFYVPPAYKLTEGKMFVSKDYDVPEFVMKVQYDQDKLEKYNRKQQSAIDSMQRKFEKETDPKKKENIRRSMNNLINKLTN